MSSLLPPNATKLEKNAEKLGEKISSLAVPFIDLHRIDRFGARSGGRGILPGGLAILALSLPLPVAPWLIGY